MSAVADQVRARRASLGALAAEVLARGVARGVYMAASSTRLADMPPSWKDRFGR